MNDERVDAFRFHLAPAFSTVVRALSAGLHFLLGQNQRVCYSALRKQENARYGCGH